MRLRAVEVRGFPCMAVLAWLWGPMAFLARLSLHGCPRIAVGTHGCPCLRLRAVETLLSERMAQGAATRGCPHEQPPGTTPIKCHLGLPP